MSRLGKDNILMTFNSKGVGELTEFYHEVVAAAQDVNAKLVIIDAATDTFGGADENNRGEVRQFVQRALGGIALKIEGAVLCNAHPSRAGIKSDEGDSGSTGWSAAFRSRLYFYEPDADKNEPRDYDGRILERKKANYASRGDQLRVRYQNGVFIPDGLAAPSIRTTAGLIEAKTVFLGLGCFEPPQLWNRRMDKPLKTPQCGGSRRLRRSSVTTAARISGSP
jgi:RecA-family ATPase